MISFVHGALVTLALICFLLPASGIAGPPTSDNHTIVKRIDFVACGLFLWLLATVIGGMR